MRTPGAEDGRHGVGAAAREVAEHAGALARLELELAQLELKRKAGALGAGAVLGAAAVLLALYGLGFLFATAAAALATFLPTWLALLIVTAVLLLAAGLLGLLARSQLRRATPPVPEQAIEEARLTTEAIKR
jgi:uncharacterized membrane protein YqjE